MIDKGYTEEYYMSHLGGEDYIHNPGWVKLNQVFAKQIRQIFNPSTVLDVGCACGHLVSALRDENIMSFGVDSSEYALSNVRKENQKFCVKSVLPEIDLPYFFPKRFDLVTCIEVLEHLAECDASLAIEKLIQYSDRILFSSTPTDFGEESHSNVQPRSYWAKLFAQRGYYPDYFHDVSFLTPQAILFIKDKSQHNNFDNLDLEYKQLAFWLKVANERYDLIQTAQKQILALEAQRHTLKEKLDVSEKKSNEKSLQIQTAQKQILALEAQRQTLREKLDVSEKNSNEKSLQIQVDHAQIQKLQLSMEEQLRHIESLKKDYDAISSSHIWRYTASLRKILDTFKGIHFDKAGIYSLMKMDLGERIKKIFYRFMLTDVKYVSNKAVQKKTGRIAVFASYFPNGIIPDYVVYYLKELRKVTDAIIFVADTAMRRGELSKIQHYVYSVEAHRHGEYDFGSYKRGIAFFRNAKLNECCEKLIVCNDSVYGPIYPLEDVFLKMESEAKDFWGMLACNDEIPHIQSWFYSFNRNVFQSEIFNDFFNSVSKQENFMTIVRMYEHQLTHILSNAGFSYSVFLGSNQEKNILQLMANGNGNQVVIPLTLIKDYHFPFVKVKSFNGGFGIFLRSDSYKLLQYIETCNKHLASAIKHALSSHSIVLSNTDMNSRIHNAKVVSFDVFDTLLIRPYVCPTDLFIHMERVYGIVGFACERVKAEAEARKKYKKQNDVTLQQIYECIPSQYKDVLQKELDFEKRVLKVHPVNYMLYQEAKKQHKIIVIASDMYLPADFLADVLHENGYSDFEKLYVSCECDRTKGSGKLFEQILTDFDIRPEYLLHIGDNEVSDHKVPQRMGISTAFVMKPVDYFFSMCGFARFCSFFFQFPTFDSSIICMMNAVHFGRMEGKATSYWREIGYSLAGPLVIGYVCKLMQEASSCGADTIIFVARDGYVLQKVYKKICMNELPSYYLFTPRVMRFKAMLDYGDDPVYLRKIMNMTKDIVPEFQHCPNDYDECKNMFEQHRSKLEKWSIPYRQEYQKYLSSFKIRGKKILVVDGVTGEYSSQILLRNFLGEKVWQGLYLGVFKEKDGIKYSTYKREHVNPATEERFFPLIELFLTAPETHCIGIKNGKAVLKEPTDHDSVRIKVFEEIEKGIMDFAEDYLHYFPKKTMYPAFEMENILKLYSLYIDTLNPLDIDFLKDIYHASDNEHFVSLLSLMKK